MFRRKIIRLVRYANFILLLPLTLGVMLVVSVARRWFLIRFGQFYSDRIGHFALHPEIYLSGLEVGVGHPKKPFFDLWCLSDSVSNSQLEMMWRRVLHIFPRWFIEPILNIAKRQPGQIHCIPHADLNVSDRDRCFAEGVLEKTTNHLSFTIAEQETGERILSEMGIEKKQPYICFHARDSAYLEREFNGDWNYHNYRDSSIQTMLPAVEEMTRRGYAAVRMGSAVREKIASTNPKVIDYANNCWQSDFMDIFLSSRCFFFLSTASGVMCPSLAFRRPQCYVNIAPLVTVLDIDSHAIFLPKLYRRKGEQRLMTFREVFSSGAADFGHSEKFEVAGIELLPNSAEEIENAVVEMDDRIKGVWMPKAEDKILQDQFWALVPKRFFRGPIRSKIGAAFLRKYQNLLN